MLCLTKLGLILWKNWLFRKRHFIMTALELIFPILFAVLVFFMRKAGGEQFQVTFVATFTSGSQINIMDADGNSGYYFGGNRDVKKYILFTPEYAESFLQVMKKNIGGGVKFKGVSSKEVIDSWTTKSNKDGEVMIAGIVFEGLKEGERNFNNLVYKIKLPVDWNEWHTDELERINFFKGPPGKNEYQSRGKFMLFQHLIAIGVIQNKSESKDLLEKYSISTEEFIFPPYYDDKGFSNILNFILPLFITLSYIFTAPITVRRIVREKEIGIKELMKLMGIPTWIQWFGWFVSSFIMMAISAIVIISLLCAKSDVGTAVLDKSAPELLYIIFLFYIASAICFCFALTTMFKRPTLAAAFTILIWLLSFCIPYYSYLQKYRTLSQLEKMSIALFPNMALAWAIRIIAGFESQGVGLQWSNLAEFGSRSDNITMLHIILIMIIDIILYLFITWYMDNVFPGAFGVPKPFYFICTKNYWKSEKSTERVKSAEVAESDKDKFEAEPVGLTPVIVIKKLFKSYGWGKSEAFAVNNLSLNIYEGQITALLGHNGAGKTTTMSILTGMFPPSKGTAYIKGHDIRTDIDSVRNNLGLCPQHNMLFDSLTVEEHLLFFGRLKVNSWKQLKIDVNELINKLQLGSKKNTFARNLSGGMKRKLNLGISLIGGPKVVMLDEPTSGMDPEARRAIWDLLQEYRSNRCIVLSTHFMEEADVLGDRIAIMARGQIECCGSPLFLKKRYGAGYHLTINIEDDANIDEISNNVYRFVTTSFLKNNSNTELSYILPSDTTKEFPVLFEHLETNAQELKIKNFGLSVTTMEEVFLKVGEMAENDNESSTKDSSSDSTVIILKPESSAGVANLRKNVGLRLICQQFYGLLLKRYYYARRRFILLIGQILVPAITIILFLLLNNKMMLFDNTLPARRMDLGEYTNCYTFEHHDDNAISAQLANKFQLSLPKDCKVEETKDAIEYVKNKGENDFSFYRTKLLVGASFASTTNDISQIRIFFNNFYYHTPPTGLNLIHNAILKYESKKDELSLTVINEPYEMNNDYGDYGHMDGRGGTTAIVRAIVIGVFIPIALAVLTASFIDFVVHERITKSKHIQFMTGVGGVLFWSVSFLWDFFICFVSICIMVILFVAMDSTVTFTSDNIGVVFLFLFVFCWAAIPFTYLLSFAFKAAAVGFTILSVVSISVSLCFGLWNFFDPMDWQRIFALIPLYSANCAFMKTVVIANLNSHCEVMSKKTLEVLCNPTSRTNVPRRLLMCCENCGDYCLKKMPYITSERYGSCSELVALIITGFVYFFIIFLIDSSIFHFIGHWLNQFMMRRRRRATVMTSVSKLDDDVLAERERILNTNNTLNHESSRDILLVSDLTKQFGSLVAVDRLNFGVESGVCFGLLGINGAGKTTTFRMLTGDLYVTSGDAFIHKYSITKKRDKYISNIGYCPQFDALLDHVTGKELLRVFAYLHGIERRQIDVVINKTLVNFDLTNHANKLVLAYSGGNKRKLSTALAFIGQPPVVFLDEPTTGVDPIARRKLWTMITSSNKSGTAVILTSHSMEECEVLCSRIGIMVNGQFQCLGGSQYLKNKFSQGYTILAKLKRSSGLNAEQEQVNQTELQRFIENKFPSASLKDVHQGLVHYQVTDLNTKLTDLFATMEMAKERFELEDYSVSQATLEQVFLSFARMQRVVADPAEIRT